MERHGAIGEVARGPLRTKRWRPATRCAGAIGAILMVVRVTLHRPPSTLMPLWDRARLAAQSDQSGRLFSFRAGLHWPPASNVLTGLPGADRGITTYSVPLQ